MNAEYVITEPIGFFAWLIFGTFLLGWFSGCLIFVAEIFTEVRMALQGVPREERPKGHRILKKYIRSDDLE